ncbi:MAG: hypothetical protein A2017_04520 [Lentisphaerae bacterium GWF2_44_16]|nr:MAG: hypothetical protein A2017_04520 [Lentisphaerae bacterium GWF2_44_16]
MKKIFYLFVFVVFCLFAGMIESSSAQEKPAAKSSMLSALAGKPSGNQGPKQPTRVSSDSMSVDMSKNISVFTGNVIVDDERMKINCNQMTLYFEDKEPVEAVPEKTEKAVKTEEKKAASTEEDLGDKKELSKIICTGNVIILRKIYDQEEQKKGEQKSLSGRADYDVKAGKIYLTENNPVIYRGYDELRAKKITIWIDSERVDSEGNVQITVNQNPAPVEDKMEKKKDDAKVVDDDKKESDANLSGDDKKKDDAENAGKRTFKID